MSERSDVQATIKHYLASEFPGQGYELTHDTNLLEDWFLDSLSIIETVMFLETKLNVKMTRRDINAENFESINTLTKFVITAKNRS